MAPHASYLSCLAKKGNPKKAPPVCRPCGVPSISRKQAGLRTGDKKRKSFNRGKKISRYFLLPGGHVVPTRIESKAPCAAFGYAIARLDGLFRANGDRQDLLQKVSRPPIKEPDVSIMFIVFRYSVTKGL